MTDPINHKYSIYKRVFSKDIWLGETEQFKIIETFTSIDGYRSRICDEVFNSFEDAEKHIIAKKRKGSES